MTATARTLDTNWVSSICPSGPCFSTPLSAMGVETCGLNQQVSCSLVLDGFGQWGSSADLMETLSLNWRSLLFNVAFSTHLSPWGPRAPVLCSFRPRGGNNSVTSSELLHYSFCLSYLIRTFANSPLNHPQINLIWVCHLFPVGNFLHDNFRGTGVFEGGRNGLEALIEIKKDVSISEIHWRNLGEQSVILYSEGDKVFQEVEDTGHVCRL